MCPAPTRTASYIDAVAAGAAAAQRKERGALDQRALAPRGRRKQRGEHLGAPQGLVGGAEIAVVEVVAGAALVPVEREVGPAGVLGADGRPRPRRR